MSVFCARLAHSTRDVVVTYPAENRAAWFDGHVRAFEIWGGAPAEIWYDNPSGLGGFRRGTFHPAPEFLALQSAYRFRAHHCTPGEGHEKGLVEGLVGYARRTYLVPLPADRTSASDGRRRDDGARRDYRRFAVDLARPEGVGRASADGPRCALYAHIEVDGRSEWLALLKAIP